MVDYTEGSGRQYHTNVGMGDVGRYVIMPGTDVYRRSTGGLGRNQSTSRKPHRKIGSFSQKKWRYMVSFRT